MKRVFHTGVIWLFLFVATLQAAFTEFYCNPSTGSNMNGGSDENASPSYSATNGGWDSGTGVFTPTSGDPSASVTVGQFASVFNDGATTPVFVGRVTAVNATTITVSTTAKSGTAPTTSATARSINVGGVWLGPNAAVGFPLNFVANTQTNAAADTVRINLKNNATYSISAVVAPNQVGPMTVQGYSTTVGDGGRATIDGSTNTIVLFNPTSTADEWNYYDLIFSNNGASGTNSGVVVPSGCNLNLFTRIKLSSIRGHGIVCTGSAVLTEIEATACNQSNSANLGAITFFGGCKLSYAYIHDNPGVNSIGCYINNPSINSVENCIFDASGGITIANSVLTVKIENCDFNNTNTHGIHIVTNANGLILLVDNTNFIECNGWAINGSSAFSRNGRVQNCGFGSGTQVNLSGNTTGLRNILESGSVIYAANVTPWSDPANGNFTIVLPAAKGAGRGAFATGLLNTVGYPDIGAAQHQSIPGVSKARVVNHAN